jgi:serine/threonine protein kinase
VNALKPIQTKKSWNAAPDVGVDEQLAHFYFSQLIAGVEYMQQHGVCHRDLKPENLLLDESGSCCSEFHWSKFEPIF